MIWGSALFLGSASECANVQMNLEPITPFLPLVFIFGAMVGSFLNVCIARIPKDESIVRPRSRCPECQAPIAAFDNIPVLSYLVLRGRCRGCGARISLRYPLVELLM